MQRSKKSIYIGSIIIALIIGIYIIYDNSQGVISKIFVNKDELTEQTNNIFDSKQFGAVVLAHMVKDEKDPEKGKTSKCHAFWNKYIVFIIITDTFAKVT